MRYPYLLSLVTIVDLVFVLTSEVVKVSLGIWLRLSFYSILRSVVVAF